MNLDVPTEREETLDVDDATAFMQQQERVDDDLAGKWRYNLLEKSMHRNNGKN